MRLKTLPSIRNLADLLETWLAHNRLVLLTCLTLLYFLGSAGAASQKPFWFDEFFTLDLARLPSLSALFQAFQAGADYTPPLFHLATRAAVAIAGPGLIGLRLPAMFGFWLACLCLFRFVYGRLGATCAFLALCAPFCTVARGYAIDARGYGLMLGFCGLAIAAWQEAVEQAGRRRAAVAILGLSLFCAVMTHYYAIAILAPFAAAEGVRLFDTRKMDWSLWIAFCAPLLLLALVIPQIGMASGTAHTVARAGVVEPIFAFYKLLLTRMLPVLVAMMFVLPVVLWFRDDATARSSLTLRRHEFALACGLFLVPIAIVAATIRFLGFFDARYALLGAFGVALLLAAAAARLRASSREFALAAFGCVAGYFLVSEAWSIQAIRIHADSRVRVLHSLDATALPIYVEDPTRYLFLAHFADPDVAKRLRYVDDPPLATLITKTSLADTCLLQLRGWGPVSLETYRELRAGPRQFLLLYSKESIYGWLTQKLVEDHVSMETIEVDASTMVYRVTQGNTGP